jgi:hypothetical protein
VLFVLGALRNPRDFTLVGGVSQASAPSRKYEETSATGEKSRSSTSESNKILSYNPAVMRYAYWGFRCRTEDCNFPLLVTRIGPYDEHRQITPITGSGSSKCTAQVAINVTSTIGTRRKCSSYQSRNESPLKLKRAERSFNPGEQSMRAGELIAEGKKNITRAVPVSRWEGKRASYTQMPFRPLLYRWFPCFVNRTRTLIPSRLSHPVNFVLKLGYLLLRLL